MSNPDRDHALRPPALGEGGRAAQGLSVRGRGLVVGWITDTVGARPGIAFALVAATLACLATLGLRAHTPGSLAGQAEVPGDGARQGC